MKILQINCVYKSGSTGKIVYNIHQGLLKNGYQSIVCYGRGNSSQDLHVYKSCGELYSKFNNLLSRFTGIMYGGCYLSTKSLIQFIKAEKPDIVHLHCINGYFVNIYKLITYLKENHIKTVITLHAEFMYTANCGHAFECNRWLLGCGKCPCLYDATKSLLVDRTHASWKKMYQAFQGFDQNLVIISVSPWLMERAKKSPILKDKKHCVIYNGIDTSVFHYKNDKSILDKYHIPRNKKICFFPTAYFSLNQNHVKGGYYIYKLAQLMLNNDVIFIVAGHHDRQAMNSENLLFLGNITNQSDLAALYAASDITVLASKRETFSMICAESLCCGTPIIGFKAGGPEQISIPEYSWFVEYGDIQSLKIYLKKYFKSTASCDRINLAHEAALKYNKNIMVHHYMSIYNTF